jgi:hypothetical protein
MAYTINNSRSNVITVVADGTLDNTTDLTLIGKNYPGYGEILNENFIKLLENFANDSEPTSPQTGQLYYNTASNELKIRTPSGFKKVGGAIASGQQPSIGTVTGDLWWDTGNGQLKTYNGSTWVVIGPAAPSGFGTSGAIVEQVTDSLAANHIIISFYTNNTRVAIVSKDATFTPNPAITGFSTIRPGINLAATGAVANNAFTGLVTNADLLDNLDSTDFMRATANTATSGTVAINNDTGLTVGLNNDAKLSITSSNLIFENQTNAGSMTLRVRDSGGTQTNAAVIASSGAITFAKDTTVAAAGNLLVAATTAATNTTTGALRVSGGAGIAGNLFVGGNMGITGNLSVTGNFTLTGNQIFNGNITLGDGTADTITYNGRVSSNVVPSANNTFDLGDTNFKWNRIWGVSTSANYADLAERYHADRPYPPGTVLAIGGENEVCNATLESDVFGVVSTAPAYLMNSDAGSDETHPAVALIGRVPVRVLGPCSKGDKLVVGPAGVAIKYVPDADVEAQYPLSQDKLVGRALADKYTEEEGLVEVVLASH